VTPALLLVAALTATAEAQPSQVGVTRQPTGIEGEPEGFGMGIVLGEPTGLSFAYRTGEWTNIQAGLGWSFSNSRIHLTGDYTRNLFIARPEETPDVRFPIYVGVGGRVKLGFDEDDDNNRGKDEASNSIGVRFPIGAAVLPTTQRLDVFLEVAPVLQLVPSTAFGLDGALGARIFF
jgi:hypothetical protein